jgi:hypothetical protein
MLNRLAAAILSLSLVIALAGHAIASVVPSSGAHPLAPPEVAADARHLADVILVSATEALCCTRVNETAAVGRGHHCSVDSTCFLGTSTLFAGPTTVPVGLPRYDRAAKGLAAGAPERPPRLIA